MRSVTSRWLQQLAGELRTVATPDLRMLDDGTLLASRNGEVFHTDLLGRVLHRLVPRERGTRRGNGGARGPGSDPPRGGAAARRRRGLRPGHQSVLRPGLPTSYTNQRQTANTDIADDLVFEIEWNGHVRRSWSLAERLQPTRIGWDSLEHRGGLWDWAHANAVDHDPLADGYPRHPAPPGCRGVVGRTDRGHRLDLGQPRQLGCPLRGPVAAARDPGATMALPCACGRDHAPRHRPVVRQPQLRQHPAYRLALRASAAEQLSIGRVRSGCRGRHRRAGVAVRAGPGWLAVRPGHGRR